MTPTLMTPTLKKPVESTKISFNLAFEPTAIDTNKVTVLAVSPFEEDHLSLQVIFSHSHWTLFAARNIEEALACLRKNVISVMIAECDLRPRSWKDLLDQVTRMVRPPRLIVTSWHADDRLWLEVLNVGGYDVLPKPFEPRELFRVVSLAFRNWKDACERPKAMAAG